MVKLAFCLEHGADSPPDRKQAFQWYRKAAFAGFPYAQFKYGEYIAAGYEEGQGLSEAVRWYQRAANYQCPEALYRMGVLTAEGIGMEKNLALASENFLRAAKLDYAP